MPKRRLEKRRWLVVLETTRYTWSAAIGEVLVCSREPTNIGKIFVVKLCSLKNFAYVFCVQNIFTTRQSEL